MNTRLYGKWGLGSERCVQISFSPIIGSLPLFKTKTNITCGSLLFEANNEQLAVIQHLNSAVTGTQVCVWGGGRDAFEKGEEQYT